MGASNLRCDFCGKRGARMHGITRSYGQASGEFLVRNIPTISCRHCGESYLSARTLHDLEYIKADHQNLTVKQEIRVADFLRVPRRPAAP